MKFNPITPMQFYSKKDTYIPGQGQSVTWELLTSGVYTMFYGEWRGSFGERAISAQALGVKDSATVRIFYNPVLYEKLKTTQVLIIKNADASAVINGVPSKNNSNVYELWGGVDNMMEENQYMEFRVRRYEGI
ncbi:hypothetical protein [Bacteroides sp.]|uniref:hypothetical protein n=1 Tax=Bacteroides sp. TaxID=29523 RepID=UPI00261EA0A3|nr:hypothetical protein [Bacteroides sp.]MDD3040779.1 hypothetical protein [Bacteroides sp.]